MRIDVKDATVRTATVEVKTLTLSGKQVTLAVFRQLLHEPYLTPDYEPRGEAWGSVNYHPDKCQDMPEHFHVVWQLGEELRRAFVARPPKDIAPLYLDEASRFVAAMLLAGWTPNPPRRAHSRRYRFSVETPEGVTLVEAEWPIGGYEEWEETLSRQAEGRTLEAARAELISATSHEVARHKRAQVAWAQLQDLPQLFIAV